MATIIGDVNGNLDGTSGADAIAGLAGAAVQFATIGTGLPSQMPNSS